MQHDTAVFKEQDPVGPSEAKLKSATEAFEAQKQGFLFRSFAGLRETRQTVEAHPVWGALLALILFVLGYIVTEVFGHIKELWLGPDQYLVQMADAQKIEFANLKTGLDSLRSSIQSGDREAFNAVQDAVQSIKSANQSLIQQLALAKRENDTLSDMAKQNTGVTGGYDFILAAGQGMRVDRTTMFGFDRTSGNSEIVATISSADRAASSKDYLNPGEAFNYVSADGRRCKVGLLSINSSASPRTASFAVGCVAPNSGDRGTPTKL